MEITRGTSKAEPERDPGSGTELCYFTTAAVAFTVAVLAILNERFTGLQTPRGVFAVLAGLFVVGLDGWTLSRAVAKAETRLGDRLAAEMAELRQDIEDRNALLAELTSSVQSLASQVAQSRVRHVPPPAQRSGGGRHLGAVAMGGQGEAVPFGTGLDPDTIAAARTVAARLLDPDTLRRQDLRDR